MSYARYSSDNWKSDVYVYFDGSNYVLNIAQVRLAVELPPIDFTSVETIVESNRRQMDALNDATTVGNFVDIELPKAGEMIIFEDLESLRAELLSLREIGYHIPQSAIDAINEDLAIEARAEAHD